MPCDAVSIDIKRGEFFPTWTSWVQQNHAVADHRADSRHLDVRMLLD